MRSLRIAYSVMGLFLGAGLLSLSIFHSSDPPVQKNSYLVKAATVELARGFVTDVGGEVTHELGIINAVGAQLTAEQFETLQGADGVLRIYEDRGVNTTSILAESATTTASGCVVSAATDLVFDEDDIEWTVVNTGSTAVHLAKAMIMWPASNDELEEI